MTAPMRARTRGKLGDRPRFSIEKQIRTVYVVRWDHDGFGWDISEDGVAFIPERRHQQRTYFSRSAAYAWIARSMVYSIRDRFAYTNKTITNVDDLKSRSCSLCDESPVDREDGSQWCKWHQFSDVADRVSRLLKFWGRHAG